MTQLIVEDAFDNVFLTEWSQIWSRNIFVNSSLGQIGAQFLTSDTYFLDINMDTEFRKIVNSRSF